jgi:hypothetical protein
MSIWSKGERVSLDKPQGIEDAYIFFNDADVRKIPGASVWGVGFHSPELDYFIDCEREKECWLEVLKEPYPKIFRKVLYRRNIAEYPDTYFVDLWLHSRGMEGCFSVNDDNPAFLWVGTTTGVLLNLLVFMGYRRIFIANGDFDGYENYTQRLFLCTFADVARRHGVELISCVTPSSLNASMPYEPIDEKTFDKRGVNSLYLQ